MLSLNFQTLLRISILSLLFFYSSEHASAQKNNTVFDIAVPTVRIHNSNYNQFIFLDSRSDLTAMGTVQTGMLNQSSRVITDRPLEEQIRSVFKGLTDASAKTGTLLFQLRQLSFAEEDLTFKEMGYFRLRVKLYRSNGDKFEEIDQLDTLMSFSGLDVTKRLLRGGSEMITKLIAHNLTATPVSSSPVSYHDINHMDSIEKIRIKLYNVSTYKNGIYRDYNSFKDQKPDYVRMTCTLKKNALTVQRVNDMQGDQVSLDHLYAVVYEGKPYVVTDYGNYPLRKEGNDFCFTGIAKLEGNAAAMSALFGIAGALLTHDHAAFGYFDIHLDHLNGAFLPYRQLTKEECKQKLKSGEIPKRTYNNLQPHQYEDY